METQAGGGDMEVHKTMLIYYVVTSNACLATVRNFVLVRPR